MRILLLWDLQTLAWASDIARSVWHKTSDVADRRERRRFALAFDTVRTTRPTIYFLTPDHRPPAGGIRVIYRHVDILNRYGMPASVLHRRPGFRCTWFENETRVTDVQAVSIRPGDLLVVPEVEIGVLRNLPQGVAHVIFNQNSHLTWPLAADEVTRHYSPGPDLAAILCVSDHNAGMLLSAFPSSPIRRIHLGIDATVFFPGEHERPRRIAYMPRRGGEDARQVLAMLQASGSLEGWEIVPLDGLTHEAVADELRRTRIFLAFTRQEGFGLPAAEAMACGCYVIGNDGFGGREFFYPEFCRRIESGDITGFADAIAEVIRNEQTEPGWCDERGRRASRYILREYSLERERSDVTSLYGEFLGAAANAGSSVK